MMPKRLCYNCKHRDLDNFVEGGFICKKDLWQDQSVSLKKYCNDWADRCVNFEQREGDE